MSKFLVVGGSGVMGQAAIKSIRKKFGMDATIIAIWFGKPDPSFSVEGATKTIFGDISDPTCVKQIKAENNEVFEYMFYGFSENCRNLTKIVHFFKKSSKIIQILPNRLTCSVFILRNFALICYILIRISSF